MKKLVSLLLCLCLLLCAAPAGAAKNKTFTLMIYLCGTDLESNGGAATIDIGEMIEGGVKYNGDVTVYVQTGGTRDWQANSIADRKSERWIVCSDGVKKLESLGALDMGKSQTLTDFLTYGFNEFPADRYGLVLWDHGGGSAGGVCYDEITGNKLENPDLYAALEAASKQANYKKFAFVGFDACLMATYETAAHLEPFAEYMIASEETEPGTGWDYSQWLPTLVKDPSVSVEKLGKRITDSFISSTQGYGSDDYATLSVLDLSKLSALHDAVEGMGASLAGEIDDGNFSSISRLRQNMRSFGETTDYASDMIDLTVFAEAFSRFDKQNASAIKAALKELVVYERHTSNLSNISGISILVPFSTRYTASDYLPGYTSLGLSPGYNKFVNGMLTNATSSPGYFFGTPSVSQESIQAAQIDWFSQYANDADSYSSCADSLWGDLYGSSYGESNADDFSLDSFLNTLFGSSDTGADFNADYDDSCSSLWAGLDDDVDASFASDTGYGSATSFWAGLGEDAATQAPETTAAPQTTVSSGSLWAGLGDSAAPQTVSVQTAADESVALNNPFAGTSSEYAYTVELTQDQLEYLGKVEANLMLDMSDPDFECYVELGYVQDVVVDWNRGKIYGMFDGTWATLDGQMVCMYDQIANERYVRSLIPVTVNGDEYYLLVVFDEETPQGRVIGYTVGYTDAGMPARGYETLEQGDVVIPQYELLYWDENDEQQSEPFEGDPITVGADGAIPFGYEAVDSDADYAYGFCLNDVYGDYTYTDFVTLSF